jgi:hypothetical protein
VLWLPLDYQWRPGGDHARHCCAEMQAALEFDCADHDDPFDCPDTVLVFHELFGEYGIPIRDGGISYLLLDHCPFCSTRLPEGRRDAWFDALEAAGLEDTSFADLPAEFRNVS